MEEAKLLMIDDDQVQCNQAKTLFDQEIIGGKKIVFEHVQDFNKGAELLSNTEFDLVILDLKGNGLDENGLQLGEGVLNKIKSICFVPVIFYTGFPGSVQGHESELIRIVNKGSALSGLRVEIEKVLSSKLSFIKKNLNDYIRESLRSYLWDFVHNNWPAIAEIKEDISLNYLLARRLAHTLSKENILSLIGGQAPPYETAHPMEFYVYPPVRKDFSTGDILKKDGKIFVLLTPSCDLILREGTRKAEEILMVEGIPLEDTKEYKSYKETKSNNSKGDLKKLIENNNNDNRDRFFFLPRTSFIGNVILDFQRIRVITGSQLVGFEKIAELDSPFTESALTKFVKYYNRIGTPDIISENVMAEIDKTLEDHDNSGQSS